MKEEVRFHSISQECLCVISCIVSYLMLLFFPYSECYLMTFCCVFINFSEQAKLTEEQAELSV